MVEESKTLGSLHKRKRMISNETENGAKGIPYSKSAQNVSIGIQGYSFSEKYAYTIPPPNSRHSRFKAAKELFQSSESVNRKENVSDQVKKCFPSATIHPLTLPVCGQLWRASSVPDTVDIDVLLVLLKSSPAVLILFVKKQKAEVTEGDVTSYGNALTRELTSALQKQMLDPICTVPVFVKPGQDLKTEVDKAISETKSLVPYGRWMMTQSKFRALQEATAEVLKRLEAQASSAM